MGILLTIKSLKVDNCNLHPGTTEFRSPIVLFTVSIKGTLLSILFVLGRKMKSLNKNGNPFLAAAAILTVAIILIMATSGVTSASAAAAGTTGNTTTTNIPPSSTGLQLSQQPVYQEQITGTGISPINQTHIQITYVGSGTFNLPNVTETIRTTSSVSGLGALIDNDFAGKEFITTVDESQSATAVFYGLFRFNEQEGNGRGITTAIFHTNSTGMPAPLDGMIVAGITELYPDGTGLATFWEWQSGIPHVKMQQPPSGQQPPANSTSTAMTSPDLPP